MSILKSTKTGRCSIRVDIDYLKSKGWYYKKKTDGKDDTQIIWKDDDHGLQVIDFDLLQGEVMMIMFHEERGDWTYNILVAFLDQLDDVEQFWKDSEIDFEKAEKDFLAKYPGAKAYNAKKQVETQCADAISAEINRHILEKITFINEHPEVIKSGNISTH